MRNHIRHLFNLCFILLIFPNISCESNHKNEVNFLLNFSEAKLPYKIDSTYLFNLKNKNLVQISENNLDLIGINDVKEIRGGKRLFKTYYLNKIKINESLFCLTYYLKLNKELQFDADVRKILLGVYDNNLNLQFIHLIGYSEEDFSKEEYIISETDGDNIIHKKFIRRVEDIADSLKDISLSLFEHE